MAITLPSNCTLFSGVAVAAAFVAILVGDNQFTSARSFPGKFRKVRKQNYSETWHFAHPSLLIGLPHVFSTRTSHCSAPQHAGAAHLTRGCALETSRAGCLETGRPMSAWETRANQHIQGPGHRIPGA